jgi:hypothetical protein
MCAHGAVSVLRFVVFEDLCRVGAKDCAPAEHLETLPLSYIAVYLHRYGLCAIDLEELRGRHPSAHPRRLLPAPTIGRGEAIQCSHG